MKSLIKSDLLILNYYFFQIQAKKAYKRLSMEEKLQVLKDFDSGLKNKDLSAKYKVHHSTITKILKTRDEFTAKCKSVEQSDGSLSRKKYTGVENTLLEKSLYAWFKQARTIGQPISGTILRKKALEF